MRLLWGLHVVNVKSDSTQKVLNIFSTSQQRAKFINDLQGLIYLQGRGYFLLLLNYGY